MGVGASTTKLWTAAAYCALALALVGWAAPAAARDGICDWKASGSFSLSFGAIDPSNSAAFPLTRAMTTVTTNANMVGDCNGGPTMVIDVVGGTSRTLSNGSGGTIAYSLSGFPLTLARPGNNQFVNFVAAGAPSGTIAYSSVAGAPVGFYTDTVRISVTP